jgi:hypothetical protein
MDYFNNNMIICIPLIEKLIKKSLTNRITLCFTELVADLKWKVGDEVPKYPSTIVVGLRFNHRTYTNQLIKGPLSNVPEVYIYILISVDVK